MKIPVYGVTLSSSVSSEGRELASKITKNNAVLKEAMSATWRMEDKRWRSKAKPQWHVSAVADTAQSSQDRWMQSKSKSKGREVSREVQLKLAEMAANDEKQEDEERHLINKLLKQLRKEREVEDEACALLKEMQKNLEEAQARASAT